MRRRTFVSNTLAILAWPLTSVAQPAGKVWRLGYLVLNPLTDPPSPERAAFVASLEERGASADRFVTDLTIDYDGSPDGGIARYDTTTGHLRINAWHPFVATFHDATYLRVPEVAPSALARAGARAFMKLGARKASRLIRPM